MVVLRSKADFLIKNILIHSGSFFLVGIPTYILLSRDFVMGRSWSVSSFGNVDNLLMFEREIFIKFYKDSQSRMIWYFIVLQKIYVFICITYIIKIKSLHCLFNNFKWRVHIKSFSQSVTLFIFLSVSLKSLY